MSSVCLIFLDSPRTWPRTDCVAVVSPVACPVVDCLAWYWSGLPCRYYTPACADDPGFRDPLHGIGCADWAAASCDGGTDADADAIAVIGFACPVACGRCSDDGDLGISVVRYTHVGAGLQSRLDPASMYVVWQDRYG